jgi:phage terminase small subunit
MPRTVKKDANLKPGNLQKPQNLSALASAEWNRFTGELEQAGIRVTAAHRSIVSLAATTAADIKAAWAAVEKDGAYIETRTGLQMHPAAKRIDALRRDLLKALTQLGLRTVVEAPKETERTLEDILNG